MSADRMTAAMGTALADPETVAAATLFDSATATPYRDNAVTLWERGWSPIPMALGQKSGGIPTGFGAGYETAMASRADVEAWREDRGGDNVAARVPCHVVALDVDNYGKNLGIAADTWRTLITACRDLPLSVRVSSRFGPDYDGVSGIRPYRLPDHYAALALTPVWRSGWPGIDVIRHAHRYIMGPGSIHPSRGEYRVMDESTGLFLPTLPHVDDLPELPESWCAALLTPDAGRERTDTAVSVYWSEGKPCRAVHSALGQALSELEHGRHDGTLAALMALTRLGEQGHEGVRRAVDTLRGAFTTAVTTTGAGDTRDAKTAKAEWDRMTVDLDRKVEAKGRTPESDRGCCGSLTGKAAERLAADLERALAGVDADGVIITGTPVSPAQATESAEVPTPAPPVASTPTAAEDAGRVDLDDSAFWEARPVLSYLRTFARSRLVPPAQLLLAALVHTAAEVSPRVQLPPIVGGNASLNLYGVNVAMSGGGKTSSVAACRDLHAWTASVASPGTGEGILRGYVRPVTFKDEDGKPRTEVRQHNDRLLLIADEVGTVRALGSRKGATLAPFLRTAFNGSTLSTLNASEDRNLVVVEHRYRLGFIIGGQPTHIEEYLSDDGTGTAERFLYAPGLDRNARRGTPAPAGSMPWHIEDPDLIGETLEGPLVLEVADSIRDIITTAREAVLHGTADTAAGHGLLITLKVAAILALLEGRYDVTADDWDLARWVHAMSEQTRTDALATLRKAQGEATHRRGVAEGLQDVIREETATGVKVTRLVRRVAARVHAAGAEGLTALEIRRTVKSTERDLLPAVLDRAVADGYVTEHRREGNNGRGEMVAYYVAGPVTP